MVSNAGDLLELGAAVKLKTVRKQGPQYYICKQLNGADSLSELGSEFTPRDSRIEHVQPTP